MAVAVFLAAWALTACDGDDEGDSSGFVGHWVILDQTFAGAQPWYVHFRDDGTWNFSDNADGSEPSGTYGYTIEGSTLVGPFENPGVGEGRIEATVDGDRIRIDFIEYWHTPHKVVPYAGTRM
jgi:hypothetical protein